jgi:hypothetical protein
MQTVSKEENGQNYAVMTIRIMIKNKDNFEKLRKNLLSIKDVVEVI